MCEVDMYAHRLPDYDNDPTLADDVLARKHRRLRGTDHLRYLPPHLACPNTCDLADNQIGDITKPKFTNHQCFLAPEHVSKCVFSSECGKMKPKGATNESDQANAAVAAKGTVIAGRAAAGRIEFVD